MQISLIKKNKLTTFVLPNKIDGSYWITDFENGKKINLLNIEAQDGQWKLISNRDVYVLGNNDIMVPETYLSNYIFLRVKNNFKNQIFILYCSPSEESSYKFLAIEANKKIEVGSAPKCDIVYNFNMLPKNSFDITSENGNYYVVIRDENTVAFVNQKRVVAKKKIEYGDIIFIYGLKMFLMKQNGIDGVVLNNPNNMVEFSAKFSNLTVVKDSFVDKNEELTDDSMYKDNNYFYRTPHFYQKIDKYVVNVDTPPNKKEDDNTPAILTIGPMMTMAMTSAVTLLTNLNQISNGEKTWSSSVPSLVMSGAMLASSLLWPMLTRQYQKFSSFKYEKKRQKLYKSYIKDIENKIDKELEKQQIILKDNYLSILECQNVILRRDTRLWQRRLADDDFLSLPIGLGSSPMDVEINYPKEHFTLEKDNLLDIAHTLGQKNRILENIPIIYSFYNNFTTGIVGDAVITRDFIDRIMLQIMASYSYDEVKIVTLTSTDNESDWDYMKILPHSWSNDKNVRFFGSSNDDYRELMYVLENIYKQRKQAKSTEIKMEPHFVIVTDAIKSIDNYDFLKEIMESPVNLGFSIIIIVDKLSALPNECKNFINVTKDECATFSRVLNNVQQRFKIDYSSIDNLYDCAKELANINIDIKTDVELSLPDSYHFLEMYQVGKVEQLNSLDRWKRSNPVLSLQAPIGIGKNGEIITLDLHEKYHGPHGLIAGTTGSGKSEFIISYVLSLAVNYHPNEVQFILIDYKGGSLAGAFSNDRYELPHVAGTITNLDGNELNRSLASIESEVKRRQKEFNDAKNVTNESTMDIYKYQKLYREGKLKDKEPIAHLFIISDEFAELKEQQPEFMDKLISVARVGRSLGIHLILATQKPGGVVNAQIWSNTRFRVCLKVQDTSDSQEVLKKPDAAYLKKTGRFYLQVGYDEVFTLGQSAWAGGQYYPSAIFKKEIDTSVNLINNLGLVTVSKDVENNEIIESKGEELPNIVKYLSDLGHKEGIKIRKLWLEKIPEKIYINDLKSKYNFQRKAYYLEPIIGEYDDPENQMQNVLTVPFSKHGNVLIYGITGSGKESFISSLLYSMMNSYTPQEVNFYILDFGAETLRIFENSPFVGDVVYVNENEKVINLFKMINAEIENRKKMFASYGGNYQSFIEANVGILPNIVIALNNFESFNENYDELIEEFTQLLRDSYKYGIFFVLSANSDSSVRLKIKQNFSLIYALAQNNDTDYFNIFGNIRGKIPGKNKGRGIFKRGSIYEFQTALIVSENENAFLKQYFHDISLKTDYKAKKIPSLPNVVDYNYVKDELNPKYNYIVGVNKNNLNIEKFNFSKNAISIISSLEIEGMFNFTSAFIDEVNFRKEYSLHIINSTDNLFNKGNSEYTKNFDDIIEQLSMQIDRVYEEYEASKFSESVLNEKKKIMFVIYGVYDFINKLSDDSKKKLANIMKKDNNMSLISFVLVDSADSLKSFVYEDWFKSGADTSRGIWIGSGIADQGIIKLSRIEREDRDEITNEFGYVVNSGKGLRIKLLNSFEVKM